ncbi:hypothetical protein D3C76_668740 [compost metagenome]
MLTLQGKSEVVEPAVSPDHARGFAPKYRVLEIPTAVDEQVAQETPGGLAVTG